MAKKEDKLTVEGTVVIEALPNTQFTVEVRQRSSSYLLTYQVRCDVTIYVFWLGDRVSEWK